MSIPQSIKDNAIWAAITAVGFLFAFYVNTTYVRADTLEQTNSSILQAIQGLSNKMEASRKWQEYNLQVDGIQDSISSLDNDMHELNVYIENAPESLLTPGRKQLFNTKRIKKSELERELTQKMSSPPE